MPVNNSYRKVFPSVAEEITNEHFGVNPQEPEQRVSRDRNAPLMAIQTAKSVLSNYVPRKDHNRHIGLDASDIDGSSPKTVKLVGGLKRANFFPHEPVTNEYYNRESHGGNTSMKGHFSVNDYSPYS